MSGAFGRKFAPKEFGLAAIGFWLGPWAGLCETGRAQSRIYKFGVGRPWAEIRSQRIRLGGYSFWLVPWAGLCKAGWAQSRIYKFGVGRPSVLPGYRGVLPSAQTYFGLIFGRLG